VDVWITLKGTAMTKTMSSTHFFLDLVQELLDTKLPLPQKLYFKFVLFIHIYTFIEIYLWSIFSYQLIPTFLWIIT